MKLAYPYLYLDARDFQVNWGGRVVDLVLLVAVGVNQGGYQEVLAVEPAGGERKEAWRNRLKGLREGGLRGVREGISHDHPSLRPAVMAELSGVGWQRCVVHVARKGLAHVPQSEGGLDPPRVLEFLRGHQRHLKSTNVLEWVSREVNCGTEGVGVFPNKKRLANLDTVVRLQDWAFRRYRDMGLLWAAESEPTKIAT
ncbi:hypothetical protein TJA_19900 [Thermus sp. LT1-2-5]